MRNRTSAFWIASFISPLARKATKPALSQCADLISERGFRLGGPLCAKRGFNRKAHARGSTEDARSLIVGEPHLTSELGQGIVFRAGRLASVSDLCVAGISFGKSLRAGVLCFREKDGEAIFQSFGQRVTIFFNFPSFKERRERSFWTETSLFLAEQKKGAVPLRPG